MSTRSMIFVKVLPKDLGKEVKPDKNLIYAKGLQFENIDDDSRIAETEVDKFPGVLLDKKYIGIYHHWEGDPLGVGRPLTENFNTYKSALNLMLYGSESSIIGSVRPYALRGGTYKSDDEDPPILEDEIPLDLAYSCWADYVYLFTKGAWHVASALPGEFSGEYEWISLQEIITICDKMDEAIACVAHQQKQYKVPRCPRCGKNNMHYSRNMETYGALSRRADIEICDECGEAEALEDNSDIPPLPLVEWDMFNEFFKQRTACFTENEHHDDDY